MPRGRCVPDDQVAEQPIDEHGTRSVTARETPARFIGETVVMQGTRALEVRLRDEAGQYRVFVHRKAGEDILVLRAFRKKSAQTPSSELEIARRRLKELTDES